VAGFTVSSSAGPFVLFPKAVELRSPDGRFVVRNVEREGPATEFVGVCQSLWLVEVAANLPANSVTIWAWRRLPGRTTISWSLQSTLPRATSRALVFPVSGTCEVVVFDKPTLLCVLPAETRGTMEERPRVCRGIAH
jgi:hypothetical protein